MLGGLALGCNAMLDIESAALEPGSVAADGGATVGEPAHVESAGNGPAGSESVSAALGGDADGAASDATTGAPMPSSPSSPVMRD